MSEGDPTWDLSPNDIAALKAVLVNFNRRADEIGALAERVQVLEAERDELVAAAKQAYGALVMNEPCYDVINGRAMKRLQAALARVNQPAAGNQ